MWTARRDAQDEFEAVCCTTRNVAMRGVERRSTTHMMARLSDGRPEPEGMKLILEERSIDMSGMKAADICS